MFTDTVVRAISDTIDNVMNGGDTNYTIYTDRVPQGMDTPCFFIEDIKDTIVARIANGFNVRSAFVVTYYPEAEIPDSEFNSVLSRLMPWLTQIGTRYTEDGETDENPTYFNTMNLTSNKADDLVTIEFAVTYDCIKKEDIPLMEALWQKQTTKK